MKQKVLLDSNIIIYSTLTDYDFLTHDLSNYFLTACAISKVEVLGYHKLSNTDKTYFTEYFTTIPLYAVNMKVINHATKLRQIKKMSLGDAIIACTALINETPLVTRNSSDFDWIDNLNVINPFDSYRPKKL